MACVDCAKAAGVYSNGYGEREVICSICNGKGYHLEELSSGEVIQIECGHCSGTGKCI